MWSYSCYKYLEVLLLRILNSKRDKGCVKIASGESRIILFVLRIQLKLNTALLSTVRAFVRPSVTGVTSLISHIYKGINATLIIRGPIKPYIIWIKIIRAIFLAKTRPDKTISSAQTNMTIRPVHKNLFLEFPKYPGRFMLHFDI